ncbi:MAG: hypothetical protein WBQ57_07070, partial [Rhodanobacteraceae bacterium]
MRLTGPRGWIRCGRKPHPVPDAWWRGEVIRMGVVAVAKAFRIFLLVLAGAVATAASPQMTVLAPGAMRSDRLAIGEEQHYRIDLMRGQAVVLALTQLDATLQLRWMTSAGARSPLFQNDAGRHARLRLTLVADDDTSWRIDVAAENASLPASYRLEVSKAHPATAIDRERALAEQSLARAETLRRETGSLESGHRPANDVAVDARAQFQAAIDHGEAAEDDCILLMAHADLARLQYARGDYANAAQSAKSALRFGCGEDSDASAAAERAVAERTLGSALGYTGDLVGGTSAQERALALYRQTGDPHFQAMALGNLSADYRVLGETHKALDAAQRTLRLAIASHDAKRALFARESIAAIHLQRGELALGREAYRQTIEDLKKTPNPMIEGMAWNDLGLLYGELGDDEASTRAYLKAETAWQAGGNADGLVETRINEAEAELRNGHVERASNLFESALGYYASHKRERERAHALGGL